MKFKVGDYVKIIKIIESKNDKSVILEEVRKMVGITTRIIKIVNDKYPCLVETKHRAYKFKEAELKLSTKEEYEQSMIEREI